MLEKLRDIWINILGRLSSALKSFEDSSTFERGMRRYEALPPKRQQTILTLLKVTLIFLLALIIVGPPFMLLSKISHIRSLERLEGNVTQFQNELETRLRGFAAPSGWKPMASNSAEALAAAFNEYMPSIGIPEDYGNMTAAGNSLNLTAHEISLRQAIHTLFELEGLFPKLQCTSWIVRVNASKHDLVDVEGTFTFNPAFAGQLAEGEETGPGGESEDENVPEKTPLPPPHGATSGTKTKNTPINNNAPSQQNNGGDYRGDYLPPGGGGDFEDFTPPEIPDELPPPPPPPGFDEEQ